MLHDVAEGSSDERTVSQSGTAETGAGPELRELGMLFQNGQTCAENGMERSIPFAQHFRSGVHTADPVAKTGRGVHRFFVQPEQPRQSSRRSSHTNHSRSAAEHGQIVA